MLVNNMSQLFIAEIMERYGREMKAYLMSRIEKQEKMRLKGENEFETIWLVAEVEGRKRELQDLIKDLDKIWTTPIKSSI